jgi:hypothetical protein
MADEYRGACVDTAFGEFPLPRRNLDLDGFPQMIMVTNNNIGALTLGVGYGTEYFIGIFFKDDASLVNTHLIYPGAL